MGSEPRVRKRDDTSGKEKRKWREAVGEGDEETYPSRVNQLGQGTIKAGQDKARQRKGKAKQRRGLPLTSNHRLRRDSLGSYTEHNVSNCSTKPPWACVDGGMQQLVG